MPSQPRRVARAHRYEVPTRTAVAARLQELATDDSPARRESAADWAMEYILYDEPQIHAEIDDIAVYHALEALSGADTPTTDRRFRFGPEDFSLWRAELLNAPTA